MWSNFPYKTLITEGKIYLHSLDLLGMSEMGRQKTNKEANRLLKYLEQKEEAEVSLSISCKIKCMRNLSENS